MSVHMLGMRNKLEEVTDSGWSEGAYVLSLLINILKMNHVSCN